MVRGRFAVFAALALCLAAAVPCGARGNDDPWLADVDLRLIGADVGVGYRGFQLFPNVDTVLWSYLGGGYEWQEYYRTPSGALIGPGGLGSANPGYMRIELLGRVGIAQGIVWNDDTMRNLLEVFVFFNSRYDTNQIAPGQTLSDAMIDDRTGTFQNTLLGGLGLNGVHDDVDHKVRRGVSAELSAEWGPSWLFNTLIGSADFVRFNANTRIFLPFFDVAPDRPVNLLSAYLAENLSVDYAIGIGAPVPLVIRQSFGGRRPQTGLGSAVRGVAWGSYDTNLKAVNNLELRVNLPALVIPDVVPGLIAFFDAGYYDQLGEGGIVTPAPAGIVASTGLGAYLDFLDLVTAALYLDYRLDDVNPNGSHWSLTAEASLHF